MIINRSIAFDAKLIAVYDFSILNFKSVWFATQLLLLCSNLKLSGLGRHDRATAHYVKTYLTILTIYKFTLKAVKFLCFFYRLLTDKYNKSYICIYVGIIICFRSLNMSSSVQCFIHLHWLIMFTLWYVHKLSIVH